MIPAASALLGLRSRAEETVPSPKPAAFSIAVQCWSLKKFTLWEAIEMSAAAGADGVEIFAGQRIGGPIGDIVLDPSLADAHIATLLEHAAKHEIKPLNFGVVAISKEEAEARKTFDFAKKLGLYGVTTESIGSIDILEKLAKEYDIKVCFHNHPKPTLLWHPDRISKALEGRDARLGFCADVGHWATSGLEPLEVIRKIAPRVLAFHMKDREAVGRPTHDRPFGTGVIDQAAILDEVRKHGFAGNVTIEYEHNWDHNVPEIAQCVGFLRAYSKMRA